MFVIIMLTAPRPALTKASLSLFIWEFAQPFIKSINRGAQINLT